QTDATPYFDWNSSSVSPIVGYSIAFDTTPDCSVDQAGTGYQSALLADGVHYFYVRAVDQVGNCGAASSVLFRVDTKAESVTNLRVLDSPGGTELTGWHRDDSPTVVWTAPTSTAPIVGYAYGVGTVPSCVGPVAGTQASLSGLSQGENVFWVRAVDSAGNCGAEQTISIFLDTRGDSVTNLRARTTDGGTVIAESTWQSDNDPYFRWDATSTSPLEGYSIAFDASPDCEVEVTSPAYGTSADALADGSHTFSVRAVDEAGNCGTQTDFDIFVDASTDTVGAITVLTEAGGDPITASTWQADNAPAISWVAAESASPVAGYSFGFGAGTDCTIETAGLSTLPSPLPDGNNRFWVRAVDSAGNCGPESRFDLWVDASGDAIGTIAAFASEGGAQIPQRTWQQDNDPLVTWSAASASPIVGYSYALDGSADCAIDVNEARVQLAEDIFEDGQHTFAVRAIDTSGNCGPEKTFEIWVLASGPQLELTSVTPNPAGAGATVLLQVTADRALSQPPSVTVGGASATHIGTSNNTYTYQCAVVGNETDTEDPAGEEVTIEISAQDLAGNPGLGAGVVRLDFNSPQVDSMDVTPALATTGDVVSISFRANEDLRPSPAPAVSVGANPATYVSVEDGLFTYNYTVTGAEAEGVALIQAVLTDRAGNVGSGNGSFSIDLSPPSVTFVAPNRRVVLDLEQEVQIRWATEDQNVGTATILFSRDGGANYDSILAEDIPDTGSFVWQAGGAPTSLGRFRVVVTDQVGLTDSVDSPFGVRVRDPIADHIVVVAEDGEAHVGTPETLTLSIVDELGDPIEEAVEITLMVSGSAVFSESDLDGATTGSNTLTGTTQADGTASILLTDLVAETVQITPTSGSLPGVVAHVGAEVEFLPEVADHLIVASNDGVAEVGQQEVLTIVAVDQSGNPSPSEVAVRAEVSGFGRITQTTLRSAVGLGSNEVFGLLRTDGTATITVTDGVAEEVTVSASSDSLTNVELDEPAQVIFTQRSSVDVAQTTIEVDPPIVFADGDAFATIIVTPRNAAGEIIGAGLDVEVLVDFGDLDDVEDEGDGTYTTTIASDDCREEPVVISARVEDAYVPDGPSVTFTCLEVVSATLVARPATIVSDGETCSILSLHLFDGEESELPAGQAVSFNATYGDLGEILEPLSGGYNIELCSDICADDAITVTASVNGVSLSDLEPPVEATVEVDCLPVDPAATTVEASPATLYADGAAASTITVTPVAVDGHRMGAGLSVAVASDLGDLTSVFDEGDGTYTAMLTSEEIGTATVSAAVSGIDIDDTATVTFNLPPVG
ncbi:MAG: hypothetical protein KC561_06115, partial [Myxococcales bacterium]|nr:hypothetical protein [Myxococcales bacterium]